ncbi:O-antigen ligase family protein [Marinobacterium sp. YM272]|uniref:O-antigen ligase family protein n=1 Tax=Marinobacterium sp. YM272 TaxID=3421654 RepID=UPI003D7F8C64
MSFITPSRKDRFYNAVFFLNSVLVFWYFSNSIVGNTSPATSLLAALAIIFIVPVCRYFPALWKGQKLWIAALAVFGAYHIVHLFMEGVETSEDYETPAKAIAAILIFGYLMKYGFSVYMVGYAIALSTLAAGGYAIYEKFYLGLERAGSLSHPIRYGYLVFTLAVLSCFFAWFAEKKQERYAFYIVGMIGIVGAFTTGTRGLVIITGFLLLLLCLNRKVLNYLSWKKVALAVGCFALLVVTLASQTNVLNRYIDSTVREFEFIESGNFNTSIGFRLMMWDTALYLGSKHPVLGVGHDQDKIIAESSGFIQDNGYNPNILTEYNHFHNQYLDAFAKDGVIGVLAWCFLLVAALIGLKTKYRYAVIIIVTTLAIGGLTEVVLRSSRLFYLLVLGISIFRCMDYFEYKRIKDSAS